MRDEEYCAGYEVGVFCKEVRVRAVFADCDSVVSSSLIVRCSL